LIELRGEVMGRAIVVETASVLSVIGVERMKGEVGGIAVG
jgi:hypothetical protein